MSLWWNELDTMIELDLLQEWQELSPDLRTVLLARARAKDTMRAWEDYILNRRAQ